MAQPKKLILSKAFERYKKFVGKNAILKSAVSETLLKMELDIYDPSLKTHKLSGRLAAYLSCSCGYDCRIVFSIEKEQNNASEELILLLDIGSHDDVY
jgi:mRNA-degrading endonuclease YafQ of YafQ-DinJ toxin-antitoxin module